MTTFAVEIREKGPDEDLVPVSIDCRGKLDGVQDFSDNTWTGEVLVASPTVTGFTPDDIAGDDFSADSPVISTEIVLIDGEYVPVACALQCTVSGGILGQLYKVTIQGPTSSGATRTFGFKVFIAE